MPRLVNVGAMPINSITDNSAVTIGDYTSGDIIINFKRNNGFGVVFGNANFMPANCNTVFDPDCFDQTIGPSTHIRPNIASPRMHF